MGCATRGEKAAIIKELVDKKYKLKYLLKAVGMARSTYYYELNKVDVIAIRNKPILKEITIRVNRQPRKWEKKHNS